MWKKCVLDGKEYLIQYIANANLHKVYVTDLIHLWCEEIKEDNILQRCKDMNRLLETSDGELLTLVSSLLEGEGENVVSQLTDNINGKQLLLQTNLDGLFKFKIKFTLCLADPSHFFEEVTCPLLVTISELEKQRRLLFDTIKKKDLEIAEYKLEGAKISRGAVETTVFDPESFSRQCTEDLGTTKGLVRSQPTCTLTPVVQELVARTISSVEVIPSRNEEDVKEALNSCKKVGPTKLKSPVKAKKSKMYLDDEEEDDVSQEEIRSDIEKPLAENIKQENESASNRSRRISKPKVKKILSNL